MIYAVFFSSLGVIASLVAFLFWQVKRSSSSNDHELAATKRAGDLDLQLAARGRAVEDRDKAIETLTLERTRLESTLATITAQRDELVAKIKDPHAAMSAARDALAGAVDAGVRSEVPSPAPARTAPRR